MGKLQSAINYAVYLFTLNHPFKPHWFGEPSAVAITWHMAKPNGQSWTESGWHKTGWPLNAIRNRQP